MSWARKVGFYGTLDLRTGRELVSRAKTCRLWNDETNSIIWQEYSGEALQCFLSRVVPYVYPREKWNPRDKPIVDQFFEEHPQPTWLEDQLRAQLDNQAGVEPDEDEDDPWQSLDLD